MKALQRIVVVAVVLAALTACGSDGPDVGSAPDDPSVADVGSSESVDPADSAVGIIAEGCSLVASVGSGVAIDENGTVIVVTAAHTIAGATSILVVDAEEDRRAAGVIAFDPARDLAALSVPGLTAPGLALGEVSRGSGSLLSWNRDDGIRRQTVEVTKLLNVTIEDIYGEDTVTRRGLEIAGEIVVGDSGGPVVDEGNDVIGIVYANSRQRAGIGFATDSSEVSALLASRSDSPVANGRCF